MSKQITVKQWDGIKHVFDLERGRGYDDLVRMLIDVNGMNPNDKFKFICDGRLIEKDNFYTLKSKSIIMAFHIPSSTTKNPNEFVHKPETKSETKSLQKPAQESIKELKSEEKTTDTKNTKYSFKQVKSSMVVFLNFIRNNKQLRELYDNDYDRLMGEIMTNPQLDEVINNILDQSAQILECMEKGQNIKVNINGDNGSVDKIELTKEDEMNIEDISKLGYDPNYVCKTYVECCILNVPENVKKMTSAEKKEYTLKKILDLD